MVHIVIGTLKKFLNGTFHGVSPQYLQKYLNEVMTTGVAGGLIKTL